MKQRLSKKLLLNKSTVVSLDSLEMKNMKGGDTYPNCTIYTNYVQCTHPNTTCTPE